MFIEADDCTMGHETRFGAFGGGVEHGQPLCKEMCKDVQRYATICIVQ